MRMITSTTLACAVLLILVMTSPAMADDKADCDPANAQKDATITISMDNSGTAVQATRKICVTHDAHVKWVPADPNWKWVTLFVDDAHSPFAKGKLVHRNGNDHDDITQCPKPQPCSYTYYGLVVIGTKPYLIDPTIIVNPNAIEHGKKKEARQK